MSRFVDFYLIGELVDSHGNVHYEDLKNLPAADVPQWIPCNEEQPTYDGDFLVTLDFAWGKEVEMGEWFCGEWINPNSHVTVAWMPLPEPWKGERKEYED